MELIPVTGVPLTQSHQSHTIVEMEDNQNPVITNQMFNWKLSGKAGEGVMTTADTLARVAHRHGLKTFTYFEYPSLIKGGHQTGQIFASRSHASSQKKKLDLLIALDENGIKLHQDEITPDTIIIAEPNIDKYDLTQYQHLTQHIFNVEMTTISRETTGTSIATNTVALALSSYFLGLDKQFFLDMIAEQFAHKGQEVIDKNFAAFEAGFAKAQQFGSPKSIIEKTPQETVLLTASEAIGTGALAGGLQFYAAYPMSPSSNTFHFIASQQEHFPLVVRHAEDEIAAINLTIGASFAGARAMTGSAGGGFALMVEALSLVGVTEVPLVILVAQRPGPATGLPTWTGQGDLQFVLHAGHGEFQRVILTPGNQQEHFELTKHAMYLAEKYQIPVIVMSDKYLLEALQTMPRPADEFDVPNISRVENSQLPDDNSYRRFKITDSGISPRSVPGQSHGLQITNSYEHDEFGYATEEATMTISQVEKRERKMTGIKTEIPQPYLIGPSSADVTFVGWGSTLSVMQQLIHDQGTNAQPLPSVNYLHIPCAWPFPSETFIQLSSSAKKMIMIEANYSGQMEQLIRQETGITFEQHYRRFDGRPFYTEEILEFIK